MINMDYPLPSTDPLGTDIKLDENGDLVVDMAGSLFTITDADNALQSIRVSLQTIPETYQWDGDVGTELAAYVDEPITEDTEKEIQDMIVEAILQDDRILEVSDIAMDDTQPNTLILFITAIVDSLGDVTIPIVIGGES